MKFSVDLQKLWFPSSCLEMFYTFLLRSLLGVCWESGCSVENTLIWVTWALCTSVISQEFILVCYCLGEDFWCTGKCSCQTLGSWCLCLGDIYYDDFKGVSASLPKFMVWNYSAHVRLWHSPAMHKHGQTHEELAVWIAEADKRPH